MGVENRPLFEMPQQCWGSSPRSGDLSPSIQGTEETKVDNKPGRGVGGGWEEWRGGENEMRKERVTTAGQTDS